MSGYQPKADHRVIQQLINFDNEGKNKNKPDLIREVNRIKEYRRKRDILDGLA